MELIATAGIRGAAATTCGRSGSGGAGPVRRFSSTEDGELQGVALARALRAIDFLCG